MPWQCSATSARPRLSSLLGIVACLVGATAAGPAQDRPDFSGRWDLDTLAGIVRGGGRGDANGNATGGGGGQGGGLGLGPPPKALAIRQTAASLTIVEHDAGDAQLVIVLQIGGQERRNPLGLGRGETAQADYSTRWEGSRLVTIITRKLSTRRGQPQSMSYREVRSLGADGSMIVEIGIQGEPGGRTLVYRRAK